MKTPVHFWIVAILSLIWNAFGAFDYVATKLEMASYLAQFTPEQLAFIADFPAWMTVFWALGIWGALLGSIGLLLKKRWAVWAFAISLLGLAVTTIRNYAFTDVVAIMGQVGIIFSIVIWVIAIALLVYAMAMQRRGVLN